MVIALSCSSYVCLADVTFDKGTAGIPGSAKATREAITGRLFLRRSVIPNLRKQMNDRDRMLLSEFMSLFPPESIPEDNTTFSDTPKCALVCTNLWIHEEKKRKCLRWNFVIL